MFGAGNAGIYAWHFTRVPPEAPIQHCHVVDGAVLLYAGIRQKRPPGGRFHYSRGR